MRRLAVKLNSAAATVPLSFLVLLIAPLSSPLNTGSLYSLGKDLSYLPHVITLDLTSLKYSNLKQRPFEVCRDIDHRLDEMHHRLQEQVTAIEARDSAEITKLRRLVKTFDAEAQRLYASPCETEWEYRPHFVTYLATFGYAAPQMWLLESYRLSEVHIALFLILGSWVGLVSLFLVTGRLTGSNLIGLMTVALFCSFTERFVGGAHLLYMLNCLPLVLAGQWLADSKWPGGRLTRSKWIFELAALALFALFSAVTFFVEPLHSRFVPVIISVVVLSSGLFQRDRRVVLRGICVVLVLVIGQLPYRDYSSALLEPVSAVRTESSDEFKMVSPVTYLFERPNHLGIPNGDFAYTWVFMRDYYLYPVSPLLAFFHSYPYWGKTFLWNQATERPMELLAVWWRRLFAQIFLHEKLSMGFYGSWSGVGTLVFWASLSILGFTILMGSRSAASWPVAAVVGWHLFGLHTLVALLHLHVGYIVTGLFLLWALVPGLLALAFKQGMAWAESPFVRTLKLVAGRRKLLWLTSAVSVLLAAFVLPHLVRGALKEVHATRIWYAIHVGTAATAAEAVRTPDEIMSEIDSMDRLGGHEEGTVEMYAAWAMHAYQEREGFYARHQGEQNAALHAARARELIVPLYQKALASAPDNPYFPSHAGFFTRFGEVNWENLYVKTLERFPEHPYATAMSYKLASEARNSTSDGRRAYWSVYESAVGEMLWESRHFRPGYRRVPRSDRFSSTAGVRIEERSEDLLVELSPGASVQLGEVDTLHSDRIKVGLYLKVGEGEVVGQLFGDGEVPLGNVVEMRPGDDLSYRLFSSEGIDGNGAVRVVLKAGSSGARFSLRDIYPMIENPRFFR